MVGNFNSPPPSFTAISVLEGEEHHADSRALREREVPLPEVGDSPNLSRPHLGEKIVVQENPEWPKLWDGVGSARVGEEIPVWVMRNVYCNRRSHINTTNISPRSLRSFNMETITKNSSSSTYLNRAAEQRIPRRGEGSERPTLGQALPIAGSTRNIYY